MNFGLALMHMKNGERFARRGWNGKGIFIGIQKAVEGSSMTHDFIYIDTTGLQTDNPDAPKDRVPWLASQTDMLADDWYGVGKTDKKPVYRGSLHVYGDPLKFSQTSPSRKATINLNVNVNGLDDLKQVSKAVEEATRKAYDRAYKQLKNDLNF